MGILLHEDYSQAIDVWSLGCILVELLLMEARYCPKEEIRSKRGPLFPGQCCYPLSPRKDEAGNPLETDRRYADQLRVIFQHIGTPAELDYAFLSNPDAKWYIHRIYAKNPIPAAGFHHRLPGLDASSEDLIKRLLIFNPAKRMTLPEALSHDFFKQTRREETKRGEEVAPPSEDPIQLPFPDDADLSEADLRMYYLAELELAKRRDAEERRTRSVNMQ